MRATCSALLLVPLLFVSAPGIRGQEGEPKAPLTLDDVTTGIGRLIPRPPPGLAWTPAGNRLSWVQGAEGGPALVSVPAAGGDPKVELKFSELAAAAAEEGLRGLSPNDLVSMSWNDDGSLRLVAEGDVWRVTLDPVSVERLLVLPSESDAIAVAPGDRAAAFVKDHDIHVLGSDGHLRRITRDGSEDLTYGVSVSREEFGIHDGLWWSPDGRRLAFYREDLSPIPVYPYADFDSVPARPVHGRYPMAGGPGSRVKVGIWDEGTARVVWLQTDPEADEYLTNVTWGPKGERLYVAHVNRAQDRSDLVTAAAASGAPLGTLLSESDEEWIEPESGPVFLPDGSGFLWFSWKDGHRHLYLHTPEGQEVRQVTRGPFDVSEFVRWTPDGKGFWFVTTGRDPRQQHLFLADMQGGTRPVTSGRGQHTATPSPDGTVILDVHNDVTLPLAVDVRKSDGTLVRNVYTAADPLARFRHGAHELFTTKTKDGQTIYGDLYLPPDMEDGKRYPVIEYVYGGPHLQLVKDAWIGGLSRWSFWLRYLADQGFVVFRADGRGTPNRGIEWMQAVHGRLGTLETDDQVAALEHVLAEPYADPDRVGVTGWSFGGFMTLTLMTREGDRYRVGISGAPVTDWRFYETGYGERYMDTPGENPEGYAGADPGSRVEGIKGRLVVVQGSSDDVVMWQNTITFLKKCIDAGVPVEYMVYPGQKHGLSGPSMKHFIQKATALFEDELK